MASGRRRINTLAALIGSALIWTSSANAAPANAADKAIAQKGQPSRKEKASGDNEQQANANQFKIGSVQDLCRIREREILFYSSLILTQSAKYPKEQDPSRKAALLNELNATKQLAIGVENSWQRLSCHMLLYGSPLLGGGR